MASTAKMALVKGAPKRTVGFLIDTMQEIRAKRRDIAAQDAKLSSEFEALQDELIGLMDAEGITKSSGRLASAGISESVKFNIEDWDAFTAYMKKTNQFHLIQRRISDPSVRELVEAKKTVPGLTPFVKRTISLRDL
jgi:hypothetical protein